jgi:hypothetical protein
MKNYRISFEIDVDAETPTEACKHAWQLLTGPDAWLPIGSVKDLKTGKTVLVDLHEGRDEK